MLYKDQILKYSEIPAKVENNIIDKSKEWASIIAEELDYVGTMCVEYFIDQNDKEVSYAKKIKRVNAERNLPTMLTRISLPPRWPLSLRKCLQVAEILALENLLCKCSSKEEIQTRFAFCCV